jgi:rhamnosyltransferase
MTFTRDLLGSVTVWYNPDPVFIENIGTYSSYSNLLVVVDNSSMDNSTLFDKIVHPNKIYIWNGANLGIARALNQGISELLGKGYKFALTLDQDSKFEQPEIEKLMAAAEKLDWQNTGILSPIHLQQKSTLKYNLAAYTAVTSVMTSGNILNLPIAEKTGFFYEELFIDHVDNEYCLRLNKSGYQVIIANAFLLHELGRYRNIYIGSICIGGFISHPPERLYYFVRNSIFILKKYFFLDTRYSLMEATSLIKRFFKLFFEDNPKKRLKLYLSGMLDSGKLK